MSKGFKFIIGLWLALICASNALAQSNGKLRQKELERVHIDDIPLAGYDLALEGDALPILEPSYTYTGWVYEIRDADTVKGFVELGFNVNMWFGYRYSGIDSFEITKKGGKSNSHVARGFKCRDLMAKWLGYEGTFPRKATYHKFPQPIKVVVESVGPDKFNERWLFILHKDGKNLNQLAARSGCSIVTTFKNKPVFYPRETPITVDLK